MRKMGQKKYPRYITEDTLNMSVLIYCIYYNDEVLSVPAINNFLVYTFLLATTFKE